MRKIIYLSVLLLVGISISAQAQNKPYVVAFYNLENLFDTIQSPGVYDEEFTPQGAKGWNSKKYWSKISNIERVFYELSANAKAFPAVIGVSEIENRNVLEDIVATEKLARANYQIAHFDSPDARGVDVALFYRPDQFKYEGSKPLPVTNPDDPTWKTRDILMMWGTIENELFYFLVGHWPSRLGGQQESEAKRVLAAQVVKNAVDSLSKVAPDAKIVIMGDLNDDPINKSIAITLGAKAKIAEVEEYGLFNPYYDMLKAGFGTLAYNDAWNIFDNMIVNQNLVKANSGELKLYKPEKNKFYGNIFSAPFLKQTSGQYKGYPLRTFVGNNFANGYSDHFPVYLYIAK